MMIILALALLPLGIIAIFGSVSAARTSRASDQLAAQSVLALATQRLSSALTEAGVTIRVASSAAGDADPAGAARTCNRAAAQLSDSSGVPVRFALYASGNRLVCQTQGFEAAELPLLPPARAATVARVDEANRALRLTLFDPASGALGQAELPLTMLGALVRPERPPMPLELALTGDGGSLALFDSYDEGLLSRDVNLSAPLLDGRLSLRLRAAAQAISGFELFMILLPVLMWLLSAVVGWFIIQRLLLRPLGAMQKAISAYRPGDRGFDPPTAKSPAREISDLGDAFDQVTRTVARHEDDLEAAVERQTRLVREVHHRVKNNLQVVASLLNIHSRGSESEEVAAAYASIQRRVDALAVVHRNHYAELEKTPGVALRALISELCASLRASAPSGAAKLQIRLALDPVYSNQDVAVSVAFLITEAVEYAMLCGCTQVSVTLEAQGADRALLGVESDALADGAACGGEISDRFERIITGLARQLRSTLERDRQVGRFGILIATVGGGPGDGAQAVRSSSDTAAS